MTKYLLEADKDLWDLFTTVAKMQGLKVKEAVPKALMLFVEKYKKKNVHVNIKVVKNTKRNLLTFVYEEEIRNNLKALIEAKKRDAPNDFIVQLKNETLEIVKKHPALSEELAQEVVTVFRNTGHVFKKV